LPIGQPLEVDLVANEKLVDGTKDMQITPHKIGLDLTDYDILIIPGGKGVDTIVKNQEFLSMLKEFGQEKMVCSIGLGSFALALAGLLENKKATTHHKHFLRLKKYCKIENKRVVVADNIITSGGMLSAVDLAEKIIEISYSKSIADIVLEYIEAHRKSKGIGIVLGEIDEE
ncbi:MAG: DJ-1/PfpI family protein, partial [Candidatus Heimdallarchaeota archaeon]|nr:DJ-1/PfpI family protein [Candidatus Heimdallarchaeota archaeon]MCK5145025.1 DJ-1/PfpI family protein [Candidatus Heimdallarchaeota archaeon]